MKPAREGVLAGEVVSGIEFRVGTRTSFPLDIHAKISDGSEATSEQRVSKWVFEPLPLVHASKDYHRDGQFFVPLAVGLES